MGDVLLKPKRSVNKNYFIGCKLKWVKQKTLNNLDIKQAVKLGI